MENRHVTVLLQEAVTGLDIQAGDTVVDATIGGAGHFALLREQLGPEGLLIGIDADSDAIERAERAAAGKKGSRVAVKHDNFRNLGKILDELGQPMIHRALFDLGWSGYHLDSGRGFSFQTHEPLIMTYGTPSEAGTPGESAADLLNSATEEELSDIIHTYGEERFARGIARSIVRARKIQPLLTTNDLVAAVEAGTPGWYKRGRIHPATKTFQALRIAVNDELGALREGLGTAMERLAVGGRIAVISFHSIEDRIVKNLFRDAADAGTGTLISKKPIVAGSVELAANPRARSAKLRIFERASSQATIAAAAILVLFPMSWL